MIGGLPFHIIQSKPEGLNVMPQNGGNAVLPAQGNHVYPVYETIESDYNSSEKSSMYSEHSAYNNNNNNSAHQILNTTASTAASSNGQYHYVQSAQLRPAGSLQHVSNYTYAYATGNGSRPSMIVSSPNP